MKISAVDHHGNLPDIVSHLQHVHDEIANSGIDERLAHLIMLRASQINGCAFCVNMHVHDARKCGETNERLDHLSVWCHVAYYNEVERAVFTWVEALTKLKCSDDYAASRQELRKYFSDPEISAITFLVGMINLWNRVGISNYAQRER